MKWAFVDYENVGSLDKVDLSVYARIVLLVGAKQHRLDFGGTKHDKPLNIILIQLKATQSNNLDFHLAYYLGKFDGEAPAGVSFDVISGDNGFTPLIAHIKSNGRPCKQIKPEAKPATPKTTASNDTDKLIRSLVSQPKAKRPQKVTSLRNHIAAQLKLQGNEVAIQGHLNRLERADVLSIAGADVKYKR
ncbi:MAG: hypothetical protein GYB21_07430 [Oceanospirillales bacterium]|nr:hypothetical protein [Oceanospirillales bacterium]